MGIRGSVDRSSTSGIGGSTAPTSSGGGSTSSGVLPDWFNVMDYGAVGDGVANDAAAFQSAINAAKAANGTVYVPGPHNFSIATELICDSHSFRITGSGSGGSGPTLIMAGAGSLKFAAGSYLFELDHLHFTTVAGYTGNVVNLDAGIGGDVQQWHIHDCTFEGDAATTASLLRLNKVVIGTIDNCRFVSSNVAILDGGTNYINAVTIRDCIFASSVEAHIKLVSGDIEMLRLSDLTFEGNATAVKCGAFCRLYKPLFEGWWVGDRAAGTNPIIDGVSTQSNAHIGTIRDCMFFLGGGVNDVAVKFGAPDASNNCGPWLVEGCSFLGSGNAFDTYTGSGTSYGRTAEIANSYSALTNIWKGGGLGMTLRRFACPDLTDIVDPYTGSIRTDSNFAGTIGTSDVANFLAMQRGGAGVTVNIPTNASAAIPVGSVITVYNEGSASVGAIPVTPAGGVTYFGPANVPARGSGMLRLVKTATDIWFGQ